MALRNQGCLAIEIGGQLVAAGREVARQLALPPATVAVGDPYGATEIARPVVRHGDDSLHPHRRSGMIDGDAGRQWSGKTDLGGCKDESADEEEAHAHRHRPGNGSRPQR